MKKILFILLCLCLVGCQSNKESINQKKEKKESSLVFSLKSSVLQGAGNDKGYYTINLSNDRMRYITFYDYETLQEVVLCQKPECKHLETNCSAVVTGGMSVLYVNENYIYLIENTGQVLNVLGERSKVAHITRMNLDGSDREILFELEDGYQFNTSNVCFDNENMYVSIYKDTRVEMSKDNHIAIQQDEYLYKINVETKEVIKLVEMKDKHIKGVKGRKIIFNQIVYKEDLQKYLDKKDYEGYDKACMNTELYYGIIDVDTREVKSVKYENDMDGSYYQNKFYYFKNNVLYCFDPASQKEEQMVTFSEGCFYNETEFINDYVIVEEWKDYETYQTSYKVSLKDFSYTELKHKIEKKNEPMSILAKTDKDLLVVYDVEGYNEKTWASTMQFEETKRYIGLISKEDYLNNKKNFKTIKMIGD